MRRYIPIAILIAILWPPFARPAGARTEDAALVQRWARDDVGIATGEEQRGWTWGPRVIRSGHEPYVEAPGGQRQVWYLDKARMEITHPEANADDE